MAFCGARERNGRTLYPCEVVLILLTVFNNVIIPSLYKHKLPKLFLFLCCHHLFLSTFTSLPFSSLLLQFRLLERLLDPLQFQSHDRFRSVLPRLLGTLLGEIVDVG